ncbi:MAG TPA: hypothetical protein VI094_19535 [Propionibacteriaceae bacterium]
MIGSRTLLKTLMGTVDVAALTGDSSARIAREVRGIGSRLDIRLVCTKVVRELVVRFG